ncbi:MAG: hypothetical protein HY209_06055 [Candidatus Omnitrophica bacterium]|nr:hypothetical protein [Candidatus Omnitrophota bacterium]
MPLLKNLLMVTVCFGCCGCTILNHLDEISTLGDYSRDKDDQHKLVNGINARYDALVAAMKSGDIKKYPDQKAVRQAFGESILIKRIDDHGQPQEQWLYRHALPIKAQDKVYLYFNAQGKLLRYEQEKIQW